MSQSENTKANLQKRQEELQHWFREILPSLDAGGTENNESVDAVTLEPLSGDASFRRYFTARYNKQTYVLVDAPPDKEDARTFVQVAGEFLKAGVNIPKVFDANYQSGFLCLSFLGDTLLWQQLDTLKSENRLSEVNKVYTNAFEILLKIQGIREGSVILLPPYDGVLLITELELFREWFCQGIMGLELSRDDNALLDDFFGVLVDTALGQPQVCVHRDYHSRNLMVNEQGDHGVLDFQDAVIGPVTYDLVSLIKDCYINWPKAMIREWALQYANMAQTAGIINGFENQQYLLEFDLMGVQRHLKAAGIFSRLYLRDGKPGYLGDIPRTLAYIKEVLGDYPQMYEIGHWLEKRVYPMLWTRLRSIENGSRNL